LKSQNLLSGGGGKIDKDKVTTMIKIVIPAFVYPAVLRGSVSPLAFFVEQLSDNE